MKKEHILKAALDTFIKKGFAGSSMSQIAKAAQITQSLIYHHFKSKEDLWICTKKYCIDEVVKDFQPVRHDTLENFVHDLVNIRFAVYEKDSLRMFFHWQALEPDTSKFYGHNLFSQQMFDISHHIKELQQKKLVRTDQDYQILSSVIFGLVSYAFFDFAGAYNFSESQKEDYKNLATDILIQALKP